MTSQGGGYGEQPQDRTPPFGRPVEPQPWQRYPHPPVDPGATLNYPEYPPGYPPQPPPGPGPGYGYPPGYPPPPPGYAPPPPGYGPPLPFYPGPYDPYQGQQTNGFATASLVTAIAGVLLGIPLALFCYVGILIPIVAVILGGIALGQIKQTNQQGRGMAIAGIAIGASTAALLVIGMAVIIAAAHSLTLLR